MNLVLGLTIGIIGNLLVIAGAAAAYQDNFFFPRQMQDRGIPQGFPYSIHGGMWSDLILISPLLAAITTGYADQWAFYECAVSTLLGLLLSFALHYLLYLKGPPGFWGYNGSLSVSGWMHLIYTAYALSIIGLFAFSTHSISHAFLLTVSIILALHIVLAQVGQIIAIQLNVSWFKDKSFKFVELFVTTIAVWTVIAWRCYELWY